MNQIQIYCSHLATPYLLRELKRNRISYYNVHPYIIAESTSKTKQAIQSVKERFGSSSILLVYSSVEVTGTKGTITINHK